MRTNVVLHPCPTVLRVPRPPVAAFAGFVNLVEPFLAARYGRIGSGGRPFSAVLAETVPHRIGMREILLVRVDRETGRPWVRPLERTRKLRLSALARADGLLTLHEEHGPYAKGEVVLVRPLNA